jgi:multiple sugar transport system substrate-binding protein
MFLGQSVVHYTDCCLVKPLREQYQHLPFGVGNLPKSPTGKRASYRGGPGLAIPSGAKNPDAAWHFMDFHMSTDVQAKWGDYYWRIPTTKEAASSPLFLKDDPQRRVQAEVVAYSQRVPAITPAFSAVYPLNGAMALKALDGTLSPRDALVEGERLVQTELDNWKGR